MIDLFASDVKRRFQMDVNLDGEPLTDAEIEGLLATSNGLHLMRGRWVEVDRDRLSRMLDEFRAVETAAAKDGLSFGEAMRLLAGAPVPGDIVAATAPDWSTVVAGPWLAKTLAGLRDPTQLAQLDPGATLKATLRLSLLNIPYLLWSLRLRARDCYRSRAR
jgi:hypothetical protein